MSLSTRSTSRPFSQFWKMGTFFRVSRWTWMAISAYVITICEQQYIYIIIQCISIGAVNQHNMYKIWEQVMHRQLLKYILYASKKERSKLQTKKMCNIILEHHAILISNKIVYRVALFLLNLSLSILVILWHTKWYSNLQCSDQKNKTW